MADPAPQKRVLPARERRESAAKRRASSPIPPPKPATPKKSTPAKSTPKTAPTQKHAAKKAAAVEPSPLRRPSTPIVEETLPTKITEARPLPTSRQPQPLHLSTAEYRSVAESAVLAASLHRSRVKWLCDGIFERYWTKPSKKKGAPEVSSNNPDQKSMQRLGNCTVTIEPHTFDAVIYIVRDPNGPPPMYYRHPNQYPQQPPPQHLPNHYLGGPVPPPPPPPQNLQAKPQQPPPSPSPNIKQEPGAAGSQPSPAAPVSTVQSTGPPTRPPSSGKSARPPRSPSTSVPAPQKGNTDPVIQMLATRAAADPALKELMKVVASSKASQDQLKQFQGHIDELNEIIKRQQAEKEQKDGDSRQQSHLASTTQTPAQLDGAGDERAASGTNTSTQAPGPNTAPQLPPPPPPPPYPPASHPSSGHHPPPIAAPGPANKVGPFGPPHPPPYPHYAPPPPRPEPRIKHIVVEFTTAASGTQAASQDRWLFPEYAVLDTPISGRGLEMVCSFFVIRKGSRILATQQGTTTTDSEATTSGKWKPDEEYYQAVTMTLKAPVHRTLETIARAAKPLPEVQAFMRKVMEEKKRAPVEYLVTRLPREKDKVVETDVAMKDGWEFVDSGVEVTSAEEDDDLKEFYGI